MKKKRPTSVLIIAILHLVGGGLGLMGVLCAGLGLAMQASMTKTLASANPQDPSIRIQARLEEKVPSAKAVQVGQIIGSLVLSGLLLTAGIGLLSMRNWARILSFVYAGLSIIDKVAVLGYFLFVTWPVMSTIVDEELKKLAGTPAAAAGSFVKAAGIGGAVFQSMLVVYPIVVVFVLLMPSVRLAFSAKPGKRSDEDDYDDDDRDDDDRPRGRSSRRDDDYDDNDDDRREDRGGGRFRA